VPRNWRSWATSRGTPSAMTRPSGTTPMHCYSTRRTTIFFLSGVKGYGVCFPSHQTNLVDPYYQNIELDPSSHTGYERKHAALCAIGRHSEAFEAFRVMLSRLEQSPNPHIRGELFCHYCTQSTILNGYGQNFVINTSMQPPQFRR